MMQTQARNDTHFIDLRTEAPQRRYDLIFETFARLRPGTSYLLVSDENIRPLHYQFAAEYAGQYTWDYLEAGPEVWRVRIGRRARTYQPVA